MQTVPFNWEKLDAAAKAAGFPYWTRRKWKVRGRVPAEHWQAIIDADPYFTTECFMRLLAEKRGEAA